MKGAFLKCMKEMVITQHGEDQWIEILTASDFPNKKPILATSTVPDEHFYSVLKTSQRQLKMGRRQLYDAFADYWICIYGPRLSPRQFEECSNSREFLAVLDHIHETVQRRVRGAKPPTLTMEWQSEDIMIVTYESERELVDLLMAMFRALGRYFNDDIERVEKIDSTHVRVGFAELVDISAAQ